MCVVKYVSLHNGGMLTSCWCVYTLLLQWQQMPYKGWSSKHAEHLSCVRCDQYHERSTTTKPSSWESLLLPNIPTAAAIRGTSDLLCHPYTHYTSSTALPCTTSLPPSSSLLPAGFARPGHGVMKLLLLLPPPACFYVHHIHTHTQTWRVCVSCHMIVSSVWQQNTSVCTWS